MYSVLHLHESFHHNYLAESPPTDGWNEDWGDWDDDKPEDTESRETTPDTDHEGETTNQSLKWLQSCSLSISPAADLLAIAKNDRLVLMTRKQCFFFYYSVDLHF